MKRPVEDNLEYFMVDWRECFRDRLSVALYYAISGQRFDKIIFSAKEQAAAMKV
jgi:hypothetical protein